jgi:ATP-dependent DNA helicase RecG
MYNTTSELLAEIRAGEDAYLELKEVVFRGDAPRFTDEETRAPESIAQALCAFANTEGGVLVFGVNDRREIIGVAPEKMDNLEQWVVNVARNNCEPPVDVLIDRRLLPDAAGAERLCLKVDVPKSLYVHRTSGGHWMERIGSRRDDMRPERLARLIERRRIAGPFEERAIANAALDDLTLEPFQAYLARRFGPDPDEVLSLGLEERLINHRLAERQDGERILPTVVGLLLFGREPISRLLPGAFVECVCYRGTIADADDQIDARQFHGPVHEQIVAATRFADRWIPVRAEKNHEGRRDMRPYSLRAVHEAIVNAVVHRDYQLGGSNVRMFIFSDRIEISNPGGLHNPLRRENLFAGCQPFRRNQLLCGFLRDFESPITGRALMEARGEGFLMLVRETRRLGGNVDLIAHPDAVTVALTAAPLNR